MNRLEGEIIKIRTSGSMSLVSIAVKDNIFKTILLETPVSADYLQLRKSVAVLFKETEVVIGKEITLKVSLQNRIEGIIQNLQDGELLTRIVLSTDVGELIAIITRDAVDYLNLQEGERVTAMIKTNEIMLSAL